MSHQVPILEGADQRDAHAIPTPEVTEANFREMAELLAASGVDLILMEMMSVSGNWPIPRSRPPSRLAYRFGWDFRCVWQNQETQSPMFGRNKARPRCST